MFGSLFLLLTLVPAVELYLLLNIGARIGALNTLLVIVITGFAGAALARGQGLAILHRAQSQITKGQIPTDEIAAGLCVFAGGLLLLTPGFLTDILGFSLVFPLTRIFLQSAVKNWFYRMMKNGNIHFSSFGQGAPGDFHSTFEHEQFSNDAESKTSNETNKTFEAEYEIKKD
jgi:UPF0716 protein FxsA